MIHLDTNYLIRLVGMDPTIGDEAAEWLQTGESLGASAIAWSEFITGPVTTSQLQDARVVIGPHIIPFGSSEAELAAELFGRVGRRRQSRMDSFIAATAIVSGARLATRNRKDFIPFIPAGLKLA